MNRALGRRTVNSGIRTWFTADTHFGHANIIRYCDRPFESAEAMDAALIANWNARVGPRDEVWHLGDFSFKNPDDCGRYLSRLNGRKHLILGNHDRGAAHAKGWETVQAYKELTMEGQRIVLFHYGQRVWNGSRRGAWMLYGHSHGRLPGNSMSLDVGVDCWNFSPVGFHEIRARLRSLPPFEEEEHEENVSNHANDFAGLAASGTTR